MPRRVACSTRWIGDDAVFEPKRGFQDPVTYPVEGFPIDERLSRGSKFPLLWISGAQPSVDQSRPHPGNRRHVSRSDRAAWPGFLGTFGQCFVIGIPVPDGSGRRPAFGAQQDAVIAPATLNP